LSGIDALNELVAIGFALGGQVDPAQGSQPTGTAAVHRSWADIGAAPTEGFGPEALHACDV
jgi:hypothetical protein